LTSLTRLAFSQKKNEGGWQPPDLARTFTLSALVPPANLAKKGPNDTLELSEEGGTRPDDSESDSSAKRAIELVRKVEAKRKAAQEEDSSAERAVEAVRKAEAAEKLKKEEEEKALKKKQEEDEEKAKLVVGGRGRGKKAPRGECRHLSPNRLIMLLVNLVPS
jgi:hypothetical protein